MALVGISSLGQSQDPTADLQAALTDFDKILTVEQRTTFRSQSQSASQQKPDASAVLQFVAELDAINHKQLMKSVAPRLCTVLDATQQFTRVVDTFVSSNPSLAALIWGSMKTAFLIASNVASYFDKVTVMVMAIGKTCPIYQDFALLYKTSIPLQRGISDYYAVLVRLATKVIEVSQRPQITQLVSSIFNPFESDFRDLQEKLKEATKIVELRIAFAAGLTAKGESEENEKHRNLLRKFQSDNKAKQDALSQEKSMREATQLRMSILDLFSTLNYSRSWRQAQKRRLPNTAEWFENEATFRDWRAQNQSSILWCPGKMGIGKTVLVSNIISFLYRVPEGKQVVSYHFCHADHTASTTARSVLGTVARQLLQPYVECLANDSLKVLLSSCYDMECEDIVKLLSPAIKPGQKHYIIIDGLDECDNEEIRIIADCLELLCSQHDQSLHILLSGRPTLEPILFRQASPKYQMQITPTKTKADVGLYMTTVLDCYLEQDRIRLANPEVISKIVDLLQEQYADLFLFVHLFIEELCFLSCERDILTVLENPPRQISDLVKLKLSRVSSENHSVKAINVIQYCGVTKRPLTVDEFAELLSISVLQTSLDRASIPWNMNQIVAACHGLVHIDEEAETIGYVHTSVKQHLFSTAIDTTGQFNQSNLDLQLGWRCLTYLNFDDFARQLARISEDPTTNVPQPLEIGFASVKDSSYFSNKIAQKILRARAKGHNTKAQDAMKVFKSMSRTHNPSSDQPQNQLSQFHLLGYAKQFWLYHLREFDQVQSMNLWQIFVTFIKGTNKFGMSASRPWDSTESNRKWHNHATLAVAWALKHRHTALLTAVLQNQGKELYTHDIRDIMQFAIDNDRRQLLQVLLHKSEFQADISDLGIYLAAKEGDMNLLERFIQAIESSGDLGRRENVIRKRYGETALQAALKNGHDRVVERLIWFGAVVDADGALQDAASDGRLELVERLIAVGANADAAAPDRPDARTALQAAAGNGHIQVMEKLIASGADVNCAAVYSNGRTALQAAAEGGYLEFVEYLIASGANINADAASIRGFTALQAAASNGHIEIVERLIFLGADVNAQAARFYGRTALSAAAARGHLAVVELLVTHGADVDADTAQTDGRTPVQAAAEGAHADIVELLVANGASVKDAALQHEHIPTLLRIAVKGGHLRTFEQLIGLQDNLQAVLTPSLLFEAARNGHVSLVDRLVEHGIDVKGTEVGRQALLAAADTNQSDVIKRLDELGARS